MGLYRGEPESGVPPNEFEHYLIKEERALIDEQVFGVTVDIQGAWDYYAGALTFALFLEAYAEPDQWTWQGDFRETDDHIPLAKAIIFTIGGRDVLVVCNRFFFVEPGVAGLLLDMLKYVSGVDDIDPELCVVGAIDDDEAYVTLHGYSREDAFEYNFSDHHTFSNSERRAYHQALQAAELGNHLPHEWPMAELLNIETGA